MTATHSMFSQAGPLALSGVPAFFKHDTESEVIHMNRILSSASAPAAIGPYSQGVQAGNLVFVSGQLPFVPATGELLDAPIGEQTKQCLYNISFILAEAGCALKDVVKTTIFLKDMGDFAEVNAAYGKFFTENPPARACVQVAKLPRDARIEIEVIAAKEG